MKTKLQKQFEKQTPTLKSDSGLEYLRTFITWLHIQVEKSDSSMIVSEDVLVEALNAWGVAAQTDMAIEEMAELIFALQKMRRQRGKPIQERIDDVREEIADVLMMAQQLRMLYGAPAVDACIKKKTKRLKKRLKESEKGA